MRLISFGLVGLIVLTGLFWVEQLAIDDLKRAQYHEQYLSTALQNAADDAVMSVKSSGDHYDSGEYLLTIAQPQMAVDNFILSLAQSLNMTSHDDLTALASYVPYIVLIDRQGYYIYAAALDDGAVYQYRKKLLPRIDFVHQIDDYYIFLDGVADIRIMYRQDNQWQVQYRSARDWCNLIDNDAVKQFLSAPNYQQRCAKLKLAQLEADLNYIVNLHRGYAEERGCYYDFKFEPLEGSWTGVVERPGFMAALQGMPLSTSRHYQRLVVADYSIARQTQLYGFIDNGIKYYAPLAELPVLVDQSSAVFGSAIEAAKAGYYPYRPDD